MLDLEKDLPTTQADREAMRRLPAAGMDTLEDYLAFLSAFGDAPPEALRKRPGPRGEEPFTL